MRVALIIAAAGLWTGCSSSDGPAPTVAGTWHVSGGTLTGGRSFTPTSFDVTVTASGDTFLASMPTVHLYNGPTLVATYDSGAQAIKISDTTKFGFGAYATGSSLRCKFIEMFGTKDSKRDTLTSAVAEAFYADTVSGGYCSPNFTGNVTIHK
jgi:hypothetical protein